VDDKAVYLNKTQSVMAATKNLARKAQKLWLSGEARYCSKAASVPSAAPQPRQFLVQSWLLSASFVDGTCKPETAPLS